MTNTKVLYPLRGFSKKKNTTIINRLISIFNINVLFICFATFVVIAVIQAVEINSMLNVSTSLSHDVNSLHESQELLVKQCAIYY